MITLLTLLAVTGVVTAFNCAPLTNATCPLSPKSCAPLTITVAVTTMSANFTADIRSGAAPLEVQFYDTSFGTPTGWKWDFGDGTTSGERHPKHTYTTAGIFPVTLTVTQNHGDKNGTVWSWAVMTYESTKTVPQYVRVTGPPTSVKENTTQGRSPGLARVMAGDVQPGYKPLKTSSGLKKSQIS